MDHAGPAAGRAAIVAVDDDAEALGRVRRELERRYAADYDIVCAGLPRGGARRPRRHRRRGR